MVEPPPEWGFKDFKEYDLYVPILTIIEVWKLKKKKNSHL